MNFFDAITSVFTGGLTGLIGVGLQRFADYKNKQLDLQLEKQKYEHEICLKEADAKIMQQEWAARTQIAQVEAESKESQADSQAFAISLGDAPRYSEKVTSTISQSWVLLCLDVFRGIIRPALTVYLCVLTTWIYMEAKTIVIAQGEALKDGEASALLKSIVATVLYLTTTCTLFWFGTRQKNAPPKI